MTEIEKNKIINEFPQYIKMLKVNDFFVKLLLEPDICQFIIDNNLFWKYIETIVLNYGADKTFELFKLLSMKDKNNNLISDEMYTYFDLFSFRFGAILYLPKNRLKV